MARKSTAKDIDSVTTPAASLEPRTPRKRERNSDASTTRQSVRRPRKAKGEVIGDIPESYHKLPSTAIGRKRKRSTVEPYEAESPISVVDLDGSAIQCEQESPKKNTDNTRVEAIDQISNIEDNPKKSRKGKKSRIIAEEKKEDLAPKESPEKARRRRKTKEEKEAEAMPLAARTKGLRMFIGAHVSCAKGTLYSAAHYQNLLSICIRSLTVEVPL